MMLTELSNVLFHVMYLLCSGRDERKVAIIDAYLKAVRLFRDYSDPSQDPEYSEVRIYEIVIDR